MPYQLPYDNPYPYLRNQQLTKKGKGMTAPSETAQELSKQYQLRFTPLQAYRQQIWKILVEDFFQKHVEETDSVLDLGCGWGEFINQIRAAKKFGMDLNSSSPEHLDSSVTFLWQDCAQPWNIPDGS